MDQVTFTHLAQASPSEVRFIDDQERAWTAGTAARVLDHLRLLDAGVPGYRVSRLHHSLQAATRARRDGAAPVWQIAALLHDIGDTLAFPEHSAIAAAVLRPWVGPHVWWVVQHHALFQQLHYGHHLGLDPNARQRHAGHPCFALTAAFCARWDAPAFDPDAETLPLDAFAPLVHDLMQGEPHATWPRDEPVDEALARLACPPVGALLSDAG